MHASITETGTFCGDVGGGGAIVARPVEKSISEKETPDIKPTIEKSVKVYPNPNNGRFTVELKNFDGNSEVSVYNSLGQKVYQSAGVNYFRCEISLPKINQGIYVVRVNNGKEQFAQRIIVR